MMLSSTSRSPARYAPTVAVASLALLVGCATGGGDGRGLFTDGGTGSDAGEDDSGSPTYDAGGRDADTGRDAGPECVTDSDCDDGRYCNGAESCDDGTCVAGTAPDCDDGVSCTEDDCDEGADACQNVPDDSLCDPGDRCMAELGCSPASDCTEDTDCDDGQFCNGIESCNADGTCEAGTAPDCDDGVSCTDDMCSEAADECRTDPDDSACDDSNPCTADMCTSSGCDSTAVSDGTSCPGGTCSGGTCVSAPGSLDQAAYVDDTTVYRFGHRSIPNIPISGAPSDTDYSRWAMLHDGETYRLYFMKEGTDDTLYQFGFNPSTEEYEHGYESTPELSITGIPADAGTSSFAMLNDSGDYRLYFQSTSGTSLHQFAWTGSRYEYGYSSIDEIPITGAPSDTDRDRWAMLHDGDTYRLYFGKSGTTDRLYQFGYNPSTYEYEYDYMSIAELTLEDIPSDSDRSSFAMLNDSGDYRFYFQSP